jgi:nucleotide-binding universal stress UspA family protein
MRRNEQRDGGELRTPREAILDRAAGDQAEMEELRAPRIVVGVDGSPESARALVWAAAEARTKSAVLEIVHVDVFRHQVMDLFGPEVLRSEQAILEEAVTRARSLEPSIVVEAKLCEPPAGEALVEVSEDAEMLVVGSSGAGGFKHLALGSVSAECARHARCPVVIVPSIARLVTPEKVAEEVVPAAVDRPAAAGEGDLRP